MATALKLLITTDSGITDTGDGILYDMTTSFGSSADTATTNTTASGTEIQLTKTAGGSTIAWISGRTPAGGFTLTTTDVSIWQRESHMNANIGGSYRVFKRAANGTVTELGGGPFNDGVEMDTSDREDSWTGNVTDTAFAEDDRILIRLYLTNVGTMASGHTGVMTFNAASGAVGDSFFNIAETVTFKPEPRRAQVSWIEFEVPEILVGGPLTISTAEGVSVGEVPAVTATGQPFLFASVNESITLAEVRSVANPLLRPAAIDLVAAGEFISASNPLLRRAVIDAVTVGNVETVSAGGVTFMLDFLIASTTLSGLSGASVTATGLIPAGCYVWGVRLKVLTAVTGASGINVGDGIDPDRWGANIGTALNTQTDLADIQITALPLYVEAGDVVVRAVGGNFTGGSVAINVYYSKLPSA